MYRLIFYATFLIGTQITRSLVIGKALESAALPLDWDVRLKSDSVNVVTFDSNADIDAVGGLTMFGAVEKLGLAVK